MRKPAVILRGIRKSFPLKSVLDDLNMTVDEGDLFGIIGPKGSGKTTALKVILGQTRFQSGKVIFGPQYGGGLANGRAVCASLLSDPFIPGVSIEGYLETLPHIHGSKPKPIIDWAFKVTGFTQSDKRYRDLSPIDRRRLGIALALMDNPEILLLDAPFEGLTEEEKAELGMLLRELNDDAQITVIFTATLPEEARGVANRVVYFEHGTASRIYAAGEF